MDEQVVRRIRQMALQYSDMEGPKVTQGEVIKRAIALLDADLKTRLSTHADDLAVT